MVVHVKTESMNILVAAQLNMEANSARLSRWCWDNKCIHKLLLANIMTANTEYVSPHPEVTVMSANVHQDIQVITSLNVSNLHTH